MPRYELAESTIQLAKTIPDLQKQNACIAAAFGFASKYLDDEKLNSLREVLEMTQLVESFMMDGQIKVAKNALKAGAAVSFIAQITELEESKIWDLVKEMGLEKEYGRVS